MIISAAFINIGIYFLFAALIVICLLLLTVILMQRPKQEGLGAAFGSALTDQAFGARTTDVLKKATIYLGTLFMVFVFILAILTNKKYAQLTAENALAMPESTEEQAKEQKETEATPLDLIKKTTEQEKTEGNNQNTQESEQTAEPKEAETANKTN